MTQDFSLASGYIHALTGNPNHVCDFRAIHDTDKGVAAHTFRGTLSQLWGTLLDYNQRGWGIFMTINQLGDAVKPDTGAILCEMSNVSYIRTHVVDMDNPLTSQANLQLACTAQPLPHFAVQSSPNKFHVYWKVQPYSGNEFYTLHQRKLAQLYDGDKQIVDPTRVLRVPGFLHQKSTPHLITWWPISAAEPYTAQQIQDALAQVNVIHHVGMRSPLGDADMQAPSFDWLRFALNLINPNDLDRSEWLSISAAFKQAGWNLSDEATLRAEWEKWCAQHSTNDLAENNKLWHSIRDTEVGWAAFERRTVVNAHIMHYGMQNLPPLKGVVAHAGEQQRTSLQAVGSTPAHPTTGEWKRLEKPDASELSDVLTAEDCSIWFRGCYFIAHKGKIFTPSGRYMSSTEFNGLYGGKNFIISPSGKMTDEPWKAALRSTSWTIPKVDHVRFLPAEPPFAVVKDRLGRDGLNTYIPVITKSKKGDVSRWLDHVQRILPNEKDRNILYSYLAHQVKYPGHKISWAFLLQSAEGVGKTVFSELMEHALGDMYVYSPKAQELVNSGSKFNAWMSNKLAIIVDEIKVDERRDLVEILKPMLTQLRVEVQAKGVDQEMEDNPANWLMFSNHKDAIPISQNGRRYCIAYSVLQSADDLLKAGMDDAYFNGLWKWLRYEEGFEAITYWLKEYPIGLGDLPVRAPRTTSYEEALRISRSPMQVVIEEAVFDALPGFRGGYISSNAVKKRVQANGIRQPADQSIRTVLEAMGYHELGRSTTTYFQEDVNNKGTIYINNNSLTIEGYAAAQGYID